MRRRIMLIGLAGLLIGAGAAVGKMPAQQLRSVALGALWLALAHWYLVISWALTIVFACLYYRWKHTALRWIDHYTRTAAQQLALDEQRARDAAQQRSTTTTRRRTSSTRKRVAQ